MSASSLPMKAQQSNLIRRGLRLRLLEESALALFQHQTVHVRAECGHWKPLPRQCGIATFTTIYAMRLPRSMEPLACK